MSYVQIRPLCLPVIAVKALANKMAKACYFMLRDGTDFDVAKIVGGKAK